MLRRALDQAYQARLQILEVMRETISEPRPELSPYAPRMLTLQINPDYIGAVIGPGGKMIRSIQEQTNTRIEILEDGTVIISSIDMLGAERAREMVATLVEEPELGGIYTGKITRIEDYGVYVEFLPGRDGMVHISQLSDERIENIRNEFNVGDEIMVMITDIERNSGKIRLSRQAVLEGWTIDEARAKDRGIGGSKGGGRSSRGGSRGGGGRDDRRSNDRRSSSNNRRRS
ncbi:MAG: hypothetical protein CUN55_13730 [Phototrophicales bacterium]|nr:MAG: hypothetical protein CUN55_13730 [Phototrophicales bacterium]